MEARSVRKPNSIDCDALARTAAAGKGKVLREVAIDWMTVTCNLPEKRDAFRDLAVSLLHVEDGFGEKTKPWNFQGFQGLAAGGIGWGEQDAMACMRLSGRVAANYWIPAFQLASNCSRLDLQVTVSGFPKPHATILNHHKQSLRHFEEWLRPPTLDLRTSNRSGPTAYFNTRQSARFGRIYCKFCESGLAHYASCLRYEVQLNGKLALDVGLKLSRYNSDRSEIAGRVLGFFETTGCLLRWSMVTPRSLANARSRSSAQKSLRWLETQVRPCVDNLIARGYEAEVLSALGLQGPSKGREELIQTPEEI